MDPFKKLLRKLEGYIVRLSYDGQLPDGSIPPVVLEGKIIYAGHSGCTFKRKDTGEVIELRIADIDPKSITLI